MLRSTFVHSTFVQGSAGLYFYFPNVLWLGGEVGLPIHGYIHGLLDLCFHSNPRIDPQIDPRFSTEGGGGRLKLRPNLLKGRRNGNVQVLPQSCLEKQSPWRYAPMLRYMLLRRASCFAVGC